MGRQKRIDAKPEPSVRRRCRRRSTNRTSCRPTGWCPVVALAQGCRLGESVADKLTLKTSGGGQRTCEGAGLATGMVAGADSIDDRDLLRHGGMDRLFAGIRAPSTLGTFLRAFSVEHVRQLESVAGAFLTDLARRAPPRPAARGAEPGRAGRGHAGRGHATCRPLVVPCRDDLPGRGRAARRRGRGPPGAPRSGHDPEPYGQVAGTRVMGNAGRSSPELSGQRKAAGQERRAWDSNPRWVLPHSGFQDRRHRPLGEPSWRVEAIPPVAGQSPGSSRAASCSRRKRSDSTST
jgi:hypothetical protein